MNDLIQQCREELKRTRTMREVAPEYEKKVYSGMITDLEIAIAWMETGRPPGSVKGVYGHYISNAIRLGPEYLEYMNVRNVDGTAIPNPFEEVEDLIDKERGGRKYA